MFLGSSGSSIPISTRKMLYFSQLAISIIGASRAYFSQSTGEYDVALIPRILKGIPDSELLPALVLTIK